MDKGYYDEEGKYKLYQDTSQSTIKMDKGYYITNKVITLLHEKGVAIHNKNGKGLLLK